MTQSAMRMNMAAARAEQQASQKRAEQKEAKAREAQTAAEGNGSEASPQDGKRGAFTSLKQAVAPYVEHHEHAVLYGIVGFVVAALILIVGFWPTVLLALFAAIGVAIGQYRDGDRKSQTAFKNLIKRMR